MTYLNLNAEMRRQAYTSEQRNTAGRAKAHRCRQKVGEFGRALHQFVLYCGGRAVGAPVEMTGYDFFARNKELEREFMAQLDAGNQSARLERFRLLTQGASPALRSPRRHRQLALARELAAERGFAARPIAEVAGQ